MLQARHNHSPSNQETAMRAAAFFPRATLALALAAAAAATHATEINGCKLESDYDLAVNERSVIMTRKTGTPRALVMRQGRLFVDDRWVELTAADRGRIDRFERGTREAMPLAQSLGREAAAIAFSVLGEVAAGFSSDPSATNARLAKARVKLDAKLARSITATRFDGDDLGRGIGDALGDVLPELIGQIVGGAVRAAFSGDASRLQRLENLDAQIEAKIEPRATALERQALQLCTRMGELDRLDDALEFRLPDGARLDLIEIEHKSRTRRPRTAR